jgi:hypothetical protein
MREFFKLLDASYCNGFPPQTFLELLIVIGFVVIAGQPFSTTAASLLAIARPEAALCHCPSSATHLSYACSA